ncbi:hypothetical protein PHYBLDRAFT_72966 [Phycomyces blakesleeanus NRRL 1555(-)]|uniref:Uncharacterized protein n=1 Tax=Phycomyces blakesleeanus (strain ATCC 8743b / DSM 1359 / FGSC 10004 / NBRC 33097 / NRRL 1555) TaxID=763407 RepID=A0A162YJQ6_PHYB8|nr:hypothetical protein PHYBLDRAFT_72966 [Phycomyces blakesleeanus NRRL 1555(-)]OAD81145.1 hypothetical protein PHYBLDRAFT_72966 [Phycomyces blakesleeanus NRRL 1555(-)]|eukprot:XP_018299185.1 hypothetical protein PHYBLDRAFT_72966 [Phycomyces blakesleeanus NRRL 1555(-)]
MPLGCKSLSLSLLVKRIIIVVTDTVTITIKITVRITIRCSLPKNIIKKKVIYIIVGAILKVEYNIIQSHSTGRQYIRKDVINVEQEIEKEEEGFSELMNKVNKPILGLCFSVNVDWADIIVVTVTVTVTATVTITITIDSDSTTDSTIDIDINIDVDPNLYVDLDTVAMLLCC